MLIHEMRKAARQIAQTQKDSLAIHGIWAVDCLFNPTPDERIFDYKFIVAQTIGQGCAYSTTGNYDIAELKKLIGKNYFDIEFTDVGLEIAVLDSIFASRLPRADIEMELSGDSIAKSNERALLIADEAMRLAGEHKNPKIVNVGVVGNVIRKLLDKGADVTGSDFDSEIVGTKLFGQVDIIHGSQTPNAVREADVAIVTGMSLATKTLEEIIAAAQEGKTKLLLFAETGANLTQFYTSFGVDTVVSEPFPFYIFQGKTTIRVFRA